MIELHDGPAEGAYMVKRAPLRLRAVTATTGKDVLNELEDTPAEREAVHVYERRGDSRPVHVNMGRKGSGFYVTGDYYHMPDIFGEWLRDEPAWRAWAAADVVKNLSPNHPVTVDMDTGTVSA